MQLIQTYSSVHTHTPSY